MDTFDYGRVSVLDINSIWSSKDGSVNMTYWDREFSAWLNINSDEPKYTVNIVNSPGRV